MDLFGDMSTPPDMSSTTVSRISLSYLGSCFESKLSPNNNMCFNYVSPGLWFH